MASIFEHAQVLDVVERDARLFRREVAAGVARLEIAYAVFGFICVSASARRAVVSRTALCDGKGQAVHCIRVIVAERENNAVSADLGAAEIRKPRFICGRLFALSNEATTSDGETLEPSENFAEARIR